ncbi:hypothetical protein BASA60_003838 [Batrachochytrium salamandrivorans]|nr:hypothetical protein BASA60_003838 [Batrachochytrium salamandrivorans]KAH9276567.1 hypothetical protein BASA83_000695 [Batrachochytrium salamandrivorans]
MQYSYLQHSTAASAGANAASDDVHFHELVSPYLHAQTQPHYPPSEQQQLEQQQHDLWQQQSIQQQQPYSQVHTLSFDAPLISPAMTPTAHFRHMSISSSTNRSSAASTEDLFSPLTSPALKPTTQDIHSMMVNASSANNSSSIGNSNHNNNQAFQMDVSNYNAYHNKNNNSIALSTPFSDARAVAATHISRVASPFLLPPGMALSMLPPAVLPAASSAVSASVSTTDYQPMHLLRHQQDHFMADPNQQLASDLPSQQSALSAPCSNTSSLSTVALMPAPSIERTLSSQSWRRSNSSPYIVPRRAMGQSPLITGNNSNNGNNGMVTHRGSLSGSTTDILGTSRSGPVHLSYIHNPDILIASTADMAMPSPLVMGTGHISPANMQQFLDFHMAQTGSPNALRPSNFRPPSRASSTSLAAASKNSDLTSNSCNKNNNSSSHSASADINSLISPTEMPLLNQQHRFSLPDLMQPGPLDTLPTSDSGNGNGGGGAGGIARITPAQLMDIQQQQQQQQQQLFHQNQHSDTHHSDQQLHGHDFLHLHSSNLTEDQQQQHRASSRMDTPLISQMNPATIALLKFPTTIMPMLPFQPQSQSQPQLHPRFPHQQQQESIQQPKPLPQMLPKPSPALKPLLPSGGSLSQSDAASKLAEKSNYQNIREGNNEELGLNFSPGHTSSVEVRKSTHKQAEQRRRDTLKSCFDEMRNIIPPISDKAPSRVIVIRAAYDYILALQDAAKLQNQEIEALKARVLQLDPSSGDSIPNLTSLEPPQVDIKHIEGSLCDSPLEEETVSPMNL